MHARSATLNRALLRTETLGVRLAERNRISPPMLNAALYVVVAAILFALVLARTHGHFTYCLDDPYIHLALADRIRHGLYGLNAGEAASPSSSIVWPLLFVPFAGTAAMPWLPLVVNLLCGAATAWLLGLLVASIFGADGNGTTTRWRVWLLASLLVFALNLLGLTYTGLEHSLEVLLCVVCALAAVRAMHGVRVPGWALAAAVVLPSVRYEGLLITVALAVVLVGVRAWRAALGIVVGSMVLPAAFSLFLHRLGLPWFPLSVLVKSSYKFADQSSPLRRAARLLVDSVRQSVVDPERLPQLIVTLALATLAWKHRRTRSLRFAFTAAAGVGIVQLVVGPVGWFYRYELYALAFTVPVLIAAVALSSMERATPSDLGTRRIGTLTDSPPMLATPAIPSSTQVPALLLAGVAALAVVYLKPLVSVPRAALGIYEQQYQLGRLTGEFYHAPVAVNDLGWVAFRRTADKYTLDLYGLGSYEVFRTKQKNRTPAWLDAITREHHVGLVAIYPEWFQQGVPATWTPVAKLCAADVNIALGPVSQRVMLYRTPEADTGSVRSAIEQWRRHLPAHVTVQLDPTSDSNTCQ